MYYISYGYGELIHDLIWGIRLQWELEPCVLELKTLVSSWKRLIDNLETPRICKLNNTLIEND